MRGYLIALIALALANAPLALGLGAFDHLSNMAHVSFETSPEKTACGGADCAQVDASKCCEAFTGHCSSEILGAASASLQRSLAKVADSVALSDHWSRGLGPEADTPPPRA